MYNTLVYIILGQNVEFIKHLIVSLENVICKISKSVVDDYTQIVCKKVLDKIKYYIQKYEQSILEKKTIVTLQNTCKLQNTNNKRSLDIECTFPEKSNESKVNLISIENSIQPTKQKKPNFQSTTCNILNNKQHDVYDSCEKYNSDENLSKKPKLMSDVENILHESNRLGMLYMFEFCLFLSYIGDTNNV